MEVYFSKWNPSLALSNCDKEANIAVLFDSEELNHISPLDMWEFWKDRRIVMNSRSL